MTGNETMMQSSKKFDLNKIEKKNNGKRKHFE